MSATSLQETLDAAGYAKVIVDLGARGAGAAVSDSTRMSLASKFIVPSETQSENLGLAAKHYASKGYKPKVAPQDRKLRVFPYLGLALGYVDAGGAAALQADPAVAKVVKAPELSLIRPVATRSATAQKQLSWGIKALRAERLWAAGFDGTGVLVGHLDTGIDGAHPALSGAIHAFAEFDLAGDQVPNAQPWDSDEHGTHTAGTVAARPGAKGSFGVAPGCKLASAMVIEGGQVIDRILAGLEWVVEKRCRVLSMSLGLRGFTPAFEVVIDALRANNVVPVIAVGNEGSRTSRSPGNYAQVLSVGAMDSQRRVPDFSSSEQFRRSQDALVPDLVAPGVRILSCVPGRRYAEMDGTSMATPHVAGLAALLIQAAPQSSVDQIERAIFASCRLSSGLPVARANRGCPDAVEALKHLTGTVLTPGRLGSARRTKSAGSSKKAPRKAGKLGRKKAV